MEKSGEARNGVIGWDWWERRGRMVRWGVMGRYDEYECCLVMNGSKAMTSA